MIDTMREPWNDWRESLPSLTLTTMPDSVCPLFCGAEVSTDRERTLGSQRTSQFFSFLQNGRALYVEPTGSDWSVTVIIT
jgi:hypothetical protein